MSSYRWGHLCSSSSPAGVFSRGCVHGWVSLPGHHISCKALITRPTIPRAVVRYIYLLCLRPRGQSTWTMHTFLKYKLMPIQQGTNPRGQRVMGQQNSFEKEDAITSVWLLLPPCWRSVSRSISRIIMAKTHDMEMGHTYTNSKFLLASEKHGSKK